VIDGVEKSCSADWSNQLQDGSTFLCVNGHLCRVVLGRIVEEFAYDERRKRWFEKYNPRGEWSFGEILNGESSTSVELLGLVTLYANGSVELWHSHSYAPGAEIDQALVDDEGNCSLYVRRDFGSSDVYFYENDSESPTGIARYAPEHFVGKDKAGTLYPAWLYAASSSSLPAGLAPTSWLGTFIAIVFLLLASAGFVLTSASFMLMSIFCAVAVWSLLRPFVYELRSFIGV